jgi:hypothetical protein
VPAAAIFSDAACCGESSSSSVDLLLKKGPCTHALTTTTTPCPVATTCCLKSEAAAATAARPAPALRRLHTPLPAIDDPGAVNAHRALLLEPSCCSLMRQAFSMRGQRGRGARPRQLWRCCACAGAGGVARGHSVRTDQRSADQQQSLVVCGACVGCVGGWQPSTSHHSCQHLPAPLLAR